MTQSSSKALIVWGGWSGHQPKECADVVAQLLKDEDFAVQVEEGAQAFDTQDLTRYNLIVPVITMGKFEGDGASKLLNAVQNGVGIAGFHGGLGDSFRDHTRYQYMIGGQFVEHPGGKIEYTVNITRPEDPIVAGISDFQYKSEQYYMHVDPSNEVLATTTFTGEHDFWVDGTVMPVVWKRHYGKGRVFYSSLGHDAAEFDMPQMREIFRRGMLWAAGR
ncbi:hypothetical protein AXK11_09125 [Cephaloticoccus primus]|uniref:ThuA-like domain-containing protein n=1 Tax=Cephaloticoccus primus TaxID=1548207 RepID=A0A139SH74_9BACT|nr:ThuA domain-containing protein [Cephaloticoccus primus]KXU33922.1 hypothetical protein AXK11_09125 [Cephaloticoccus primus]